MAQEQAPNSPRLPVKFTTVGGSLSAEGLEVLEQMWRQIVAGYVIVPCEASGTNALTLTPIMHEEGARTVADHMAFAFVAVATSTAAVTAAIGDLAALKVYKDGGATQAGQDDIIAGSVYLCLYVDALDGGAGGLVAIGLPGAASTAVAGIQKNAAKADMESASSSVLTVTPDVLKNHPGVAKFWAYVTVSGGTPTLVASHNVTSITDAGAGQLTITIGTDFSSANWCCCMAVRASNYTVDVNSQAAGSVTVVSRDSGGVADPVAWHVVGFGDQ